jgi:hypothetical protein
MVRKFFEDSSFTKVFGQSPRMLVFEFLLQNKCFDYSKTNIAKGSDISFNSLDGFWDDLLAAGIVKKTRYVGNSEMFALNVESPLVKLLLRIDKLLMLESVKKAGK